MKHGPLPDRSYVILVHPHRRRVGTGSGGSRSGSSKGGGGELSRRGGGVGVGAFDEGYYWHGVEETPAVEGVRVKRLLGGGCGYGKKGNSGEWVCG